MDNQIKSNYIYSVTYQILGYIIPLVTAPYISRILGVENVGIISYSRSIAQYYSLFALLGINNYGNREIAVHRDNIEGMSETFWNIYAVQCCISIPVLIIYLCSYKYFPVNDVLITKIQSLYIVACLLDISWFFFGIEEFRITILRNMVIKSISLFFIFIFIRQKEDVWKYALICSMSVVFANLILWINVAKLVKWKKPTIKKMRSHIKPILILFIPVITISLYKIMDKIMLGSLSDMVQTGLYENAEKLINIPLSLVTALANVMLPRMSKIYNSGESEQGEKMIHASMRFSMFLAVPTMLGMSAISPVFVPIYFGKGYEGCVQIILYLSITIVFIAWANVIRAQYLIPNRREKEYTMSVIGGAGVNLVINYILIPRYGAIGAAIGTVFAELSVTAFQMLLTRKKVPYRNYLKESCVFLIAAILMYIVIYPLQHIKINSIIIVFIQFFVGITIYVFSVMGLNIVLKRRRQYKI